MEIGEIFGFNLQRVFARFQFGGPFFIIDSSRTVDGGAVRGNQTDRIFDRTLRQNRNCAVLDQKFRDLHFAAGKQQVPEFFLLEEIQSIGGPAGMNP